MFASVGDYVKTPDGKEGFIIGFHNEGKVGFDLANVLVGDDEVEVYKEADLETIEPGGFEHSPLEGVAKDYAYLDKTAGTNVTVMVPDEHGGVRKRWTKSVAIKTCSHWLDPFEVENGITLYASGKSHGFMANSKENKDKPPRTAGVYLDSSWGREFKGVLSNRALPEEWQQTDEIPYVIYSWPDRGAIPVKSLCVLALWARNMASEGHIVEVACLGSHGRTGTLLAATLIYSGYEADQAIEEVRERHCDSAIETKPQEELIHKMYEAVKKAREQAEEETD